MATGGPRRTITLFLHNHLLLVHAVCFSTNVFGYVRKVVIPFKNIAAVQKKSHFRFPNSIEVGRPAETSELCSHPLEGVLPLRARHSCALLAYIPR